MSKKYIYFAFGLIIQSDIELPELIQSKLEETRHEDIVADINVIIGKVPANINDLKIKSILYKASKREYLLKIDGIAKYYARDGQIIIIEPDENSLEEDIRVFLLSAVFSVSLQQRGFLVLHGSAAVINEKAMVILGNSGTGKTAVALSLYDRGCDLISDEICAIEVKKGKAIVVGGIPQLNIWEDTLIKAGRDICLYKTIRKNIKKYSFNIRDRYFKYPIEISDVIILKKHNEHELTVRKIEGMDRFGELMKASYKFDLEQLIIEKEKRFKNHMVIAENSNIIEVAFNDCAHGVNNVVNFIIEGVKKNNE